MARASSEQRWVAAQARAVEAGYRAYAQPDGSYRVVSDSTAGRAYRVVPDLSVSPPTFRCSVEGTGEVCPSHYEAHAHAAAVALRLEREGAIAWGAGGWQVPATASADTAPDFDAWFGTGGAA